LLGAFHDFFEAPPQLRALCQHRHGVGLHEATVAVEGETSVARFLRQGLDGLVLGGWAGLGGYQGVNATMGKW